MKPVVLLGHQHRCPLHGSGHVVTGASDDSLNGRPIARLGDTTSHGGTLVEGDADWLLD